MVAALVTEPSARLSEQATAAWRAAAVDPKMAAKLRDIVYELAKVYRDYLGEDSLKEAKALEMEQGLRQEVDLRFAAVTAELGEEWINGVQPFFSDSLVREYNDWW